MFFSLHIIQKAIRSRFWLKCVLFLWVSPTLAVDSTPSIQFIHSESGQQPSQLWRVKALELIQFLSEEVLPKFPERFQQSLARESFEILVKQDCPSDGFFFGETRTPLGALSLCLRTDTFFGVDAKRVLAHEVFHAAHFVLNPGEARWAREGMAMLFEYLILKKFNYTAFEAGLSDLTTPLEGEYKDGRTPPAQYGHNLLHLYYLWSHCGGEELFWSWAKRGVQAVMDELTDESGGLSSSVPEYCHGFARSAASFELARIHNRMTGKKGSGGLPQFFISSFARGQAQVIQPRDRIPADWLALKRFQPLWLEGKVKVPGSVLRQFERVFLEKVSPYRVRLAPDSRVENWTQVLLKAQLGQMEQVVDN